MTIHRSQGSEYPAVVIPVTTSAWMMLQRNLLYTAVTRAKKLVVLVGSRKAIGQAVRTVSAGGAARPGLPAAGREAGRTSRRSKMIDQMSRKVTEHFRDRERAG